MLAQACSLTKPYQGGRCNAAATAVQAAAAAGRHPLAATPGAKAPAQHARRERRGEASRLCRPERAWSQTPHCTSGKPARQPNIPRRMKHSPASPRTSPTHYRSIQGCLPRPDQAHAPTTHHPSSQLVHLAAELGQPSFQAEGSGCQGQQERPSSQQVHLPADLDHLTPEPAGSAVQARQKDGTGGSTNGAASIGQLADLDASARCAGLKWGQRGVAGHKCSVA